MFSSVVCLVILLLTNCWCQTTPPANRNGDLMNHINLLEQSLSDLKSAIMVQEQNHAAVLSSVLSKLTITLDELASLKTNQTATAAELAEVKTSCSDELANVLSKLTNTSVELSSLSKEFEETKLDVRKTANGLQQLNISTNHYPSNGNRDSVAFQVTESGHGTTGTTLKFDTVDFNSGNGYSKTTGIFTAPVSGTYLLWANVVLSNNAGGSYSIYLYKGTVKIAEGYNNMTPMGHTGQDLKLASIMTVTFLNKNDQLHFGSPSPRLIISGNGHSSYGGAVLHNK